MRKRAYIKGRDEYEKLWQRSVDDPDGFWSEIASEYVEWFKKWDKVEDYNFDVGAGPIYVKYFEGGKLNVSYNCLDKHLKTRGDKIAIQWEGNDPGEDRAYTYKELHTGSVQVCQCAEVPGCEEGRPGMFLSSHDPRASHRDAGVYAYRSHSQYCVRGVQFRLPP